MFTETRENDDSFFVFPTFNWVVTFIVFYKINISTLYWIPHLHILIVEWQFFLDYMELVL